MSPKVLNKRVVWPRNTATWQVQDMGDVVNRNHRDRMVYTASSDVDGVGLESVLQVFVHICRRVVIAGKSKCSSSTERMSLSALKIHKTQKDSRSANQM